MGLSGGSGVVSRAAKRLFPRNLVADRVIAPVPAPELRTSVGLPVAECEVKLEDLLVWAERFAPSTVEDRRVTRNKKLLELYMSYRLLAPTESDTYLDAAGGHF